MAAGYHIEQGVPSPLRGRKRKYPFDLLKVGESFEVPGKTPADLRACMKLAAKRTGFSFQLGGTEAGVRVWRIRGGKGAK